MSLESLTLEGATVRLVPLTPGHLDALCAIGLDPELWQTTTIRVTTRAEMEAYLQAALAGQRAGTGLPFAIEERASGTILGTTRFHSLVPEHRRVEIGFTWIGRRWQRTRVNTEAKYLLLRHAFESMGCIRVEFKTEARNTVSRQALRRLGAKEEGTLRNFRLSAHRGVCDLVVYSLIDAEWPDVRTALEARLRA